MIWHVRLALKYLGSGGADETKLVNLRDGYMRFIILLSLLLHIIEIFHNKMLDSHSSNLWDYVRISIKGKERGSLANLRGRSEGKAVMGNREGKCHRDWVGGRGGGDEHCSEDWYGPWPGRGQKRLPGSSSNNLRSSQGIALESTNGKTDKEATL